MHLGRRAVMIAAALAAVPGSVLAERRTDTLRVTWRQSVTELDPYADPSRGNFVLAHEVYDTLVYRDPRSFALRPLLATSWRWEDDRTLQFTLRPGVLWQDGSLFAAQDVAGTINRIAADRRLAASPLYDWLAGADVVDATHVRVHLARATPAALDYFAMEIWILPEAARDRVGSAGLAREPVGTGPYRVSSIDGIGDVTLERFDGYYKGSPKGMPAIARIRFQSVPDPTSEISALLSGDADWIWRFDPADLGVIRRAPNLIGVEGGSLRITYLSLDAAGRTGAGNPMTDRRVREAIAAAIDRPTLALAFGGGAARALTAPCAPPQFGCDQGAAVAIPDDPARARQLLAEAGFKDGFTVQIATYEPASWAAAIQSYLRAVGINAEIIRLPRGEVVMRTIEGANRAEFGDWASYAINDVSAILPHFFTFTASDYTRDPTLRDLIRSGGATLDSTRRLSDYGQAIHIITANTDWLPLWTVTIPYGFTRDLDFTPSPDGLPRFFLARWHDRDATASRKAGN